MKPIPSQDTEAVENLQLYGSGWACDRVARMNIDLHEDVTEGSSSFELPMRIFNSFQTSKQKR